jgi:hypothetical protein
LQLFSTFVQCCTEQAPPVRFIFLDDGLRSLSAFVRWVEQHTKLLNSLHRAEVVYASDSTRNFDGAEREFLRRFPPGSGTKELPRGLEHFLGWLRIRTRYERKGGGLSLDETRVLDEGERLYTSLEKQAFLSAWKIGSTDEARIRSYYEPRMRQLSIHGYLLEHDYPVWSIKYRRTVL